MRRIFRSLAIGVGMAGMSMLVVGGTAVASPSSTAPANCQGSFDPYSYTASALASCGIKTFPATTTALPGGGELYTYEDANSVFARTAMPPTGFDPTSATDAQLAEYGYPPRPTDSAAYPLWEQLVSIPRSTPEPFMADTTGFSGTLYNTAWAGHITNNGGFSYIEGQYTEPTYNDTSCSSSAAAVEWVGIGGGPGATGVLFQDGTSHGTNLANHQPWWEIATATGGTGQAFPQGGTAHAGDDIVAVTDTQSNPGSVDFNVYDLTTSATWGTSRSLNGQSASPATAEVIAERPSVGGSSTPLSNFGTLSVPFAAAAQGGIAQNLGNYATTQINMTANGLSGGKALATPVNPLWNVQWNHCS